MKKRKASSATVQSNPQLIPVAVLFMAPPRSVPGEPARIRIVEQGPARVALEVIREAEGSQFLQTIRLAAGGAGDRVEVDCEIDWRTPGTLLKAAFPLTVRGGFGVPVVARGKPTLDGFRLSLDWLFYFSFGTAI